MFNKDDFKSSQVSSLQEEDKKVDKLLGRTGGYSDYLRIEEGRNLFRIFPPHPNQTNNLFVEARVTSQLPFLVEERDDKGEVVKHSNGKSKMIERSKHIFNSKVHGSLTFDLVEEYISRVTSKANVLFPNDSKGRQDYLKYIYGVYSKDRSQSIVGIGYQQRWTMYAKKFENPSDPLNSSFSFGRLDVGKAVKNRLNELAAIESQNQSITTDPFSNPDDGIVISITYDGKAERPQDYYKTELFLPRQGHNVQLFPLTDGDLNWLVEQDSLASMYQGVFKRRDLDLQIQGLERLDSKSGYNILEDASFINLIEQALESFPEEVEQEKKKEEVVLPAPVTVEEPTQTIPPVKEVVTPPITQEAGVEQDPISRIEAMKAKYTRPSS